MLRSPPILAGKRRRTCGFHRLFETRFLIFSYIVWYILNELLEYTFQIREVALFLICIPDCNNSSTLYRPTRERGTVLSDFGHCAARAHALLPSALRSFALIQIHSSVVSPQNFKREASSLPPSLPRLLALLPVFPPSLPACAEYIGPRVGRLRTVVLVLDRIKCCFNLLYIFWYVFVTYKISFRFPYDVNKRAMSF